MSQAPHSRYSATRSKGYGAALSQLPDMQINFQLLKHSYQISHI